MGGYYDRLEAQLAAATERGTARRRMRLRAAAPRLRMEFVAVVVGIAAVGLVVAVFVGIGSRHPAGHHAPVGPQGPGVIRNFAPGNAPPMGGQMVGTAALKAPARAMSASGTVTFNIRHPSTYVFTITASGLVPNTTHNVYAVWLVPAIRTITGAYQVSGPISQHAQLVGRISPAVARSGRLEAEGVLPAALPTASLNLVVITLDTPPSATRPGRIVLQGRIGF